MAHEIKLSKDFIVLLKLVEDYNMKGRFMLNV